MALQLIIMYRHSNQFGCKRSNNSESIVEAKPRKTDKGTLIYSLPAPPSPPASLRYRGGGGGIIIGCAEQTVTRFRGERQNDSEDNGWTKKRDKHTTRGHAAK